MAKKIMVPLIIFTFTFLFYLPIVINPQFFIGRDNDLTEFFWPTIHFIKEQIIANHQIPFWNNLILSGTPLLPDPQAPIFYLPRIIFLFMPIATGFIVSGFLHIFAGGIGMYLATRKGFCFEKTTSVFCALIYTASPRVAGYLEAGHVWSIAAWGWLPFVLLATILLARKPSFLKSIFFAICLTGLSCTHTTTFVWASAFSVPIFTIVALSTQKRSWNIKAFFYLAIGFLLTLGFGAIDLLPDLEWIPTTNRYLLAVNPQVFPIWKSKIEFLQAAFTPWLFGANFARALDTEKWIAVGFIPSLLALIGFTQLTRKYKISIFVTGTFALILVLNNATPFYKLLLSQNWYVFGRVSTRIWFVVVFLVIFLAGYGYQWVCQKTRVKIIAPLIIFIAVAELITTSWIRITKPISPVINMASNAVYDFLKKDTDRFRVYCTTRCLSQKTAAEYNLELIDGYSTLIQKNYNSQAWQLTGGYWNYYSLSIPPIGLYTLEKLQPDPVALGEYNTKYVISPYKLTNKNFILIKEVESFLIYSNKVYQPRFPVPVISYSPNVIRLDTSNYQKKSMVISEVYSPGWNAYLDGKIKVAVQETPIALRAFDLLPETEFVDLKYEPESFKIGGIITLATLVSIIIIALRYVQSRKK